MADLVNESKGTGTNSPELRRKTTNLNPSGPYRKTKNGLPRASHEERRLQEDGKKKIIRDLKFLDHVKPKM